MDPNATVQPAAASSEQTATDTKLAIVQDPNGGRRVARVPVESPATTPAPSPAPAAAPAAAPQQAAPAEPAGKKPIEPAAAPAAQPPAQEKPAEYTADELRDVNSENIDSYDINRVPEANRQQFKALQAAFTRDRQKTTALQKQLEELTNTLQQTVQEVKPPEAPRIKPQDAYAQRHNFLRNEVAGMFGVDAAMLSDNVNEWPAPMQLAYRDVDDNLRREAEARTTAQTAQQEKIATIRQFADAVEAELRTIDPDALDYAKQKLKNGEILEKEKKELAAALEKGDKKAVTAFYNKYRDEYRGVKPAPAAPAKPPEQPPALEQGGQGGEVKPPAGALDAVFLSKFRGASQNEKLDMIRQFRRARNM
jgi:hypothetical protein